MLYDTPTQADEELQAARDCSSWPAIPSNDREWNSVRTSSGHCSRYSSIARCSTLSATVVIARRITARIDSAAPGSTQHDRAWIPPGRSALDSALLRQARQSLDRLSGSWEPWLLLPSQLVYLARPVSAGKLAPQALICMIQVVPAVPVFVYPVCNPLTTALSLFQIPDLFAQSDLSWFLLLGDFSRSAGFRGVAPPVPRSSHIKCYLSL
jgi:hypothetical protein